MARMMCIFGFLFLVSAALASASMPQEKIKVTVYYEALCPDSKKFIFEQLAPAYSNFSSHMNITFVPFGKSTYNKSDDGQYTFMCHHGELECYGNKVQACALSILPDDKIVDYINCLMTTPNNNTNNTATYPTHYCADLKGLKIEYPQIETCVNTSQGSVLLAANGDKTVAFQNPLQHVPAVVFNDKYVMEEDELAKKDFKTALCNKFTGPKPAECPADGSAVSFNPGFLPLMLVSIVTIFSRL